MNIARMEKFESLWAVRHDLPAESLVQYRFESREGYRLPELAAHYRTHCEALDSMAAENASLQKAYAEAWEKARSIQSECDEFAKDANRYRWLRSPAVGPHIISTHLFETISDDCNPPYRTMKIDKELDEAIDLRMSAAK